MLDLSKIASALGASAPQRDISSIAIDSRSVVDPASTLFIAIATDANDGHRYISRLYDKGVRAFIVNSSAALPPQLDDATVIKVDDTARALHQLGHLSFLSLAGRHIPVVGITGSRGKTVVKEMLYEALAPQCRVARSPRSYNSRIGAPLSLLTLPHDIDLAIIEAGISRPGEMADMARLFTPSLGIITSVTAEHSTNFSSRRQQIHEKLLLFAHTPAIIFNSDDSEISEAVAATYPDRELIGVAAGYPDIDDSALVAAAVERLGYNRPAAFAPAVKTRLDIIEGVNGCKLIMDEFTADLQSLAGALDFLHRRAPESLSRTLIISPGDFIGGLDGLPRLLADYNISRLITIGGHASVSVPDRCLHSHFDSVAMLSANDFGNEAILIKDSRTNPLHDIYTMLEAKQHETVLEVNLDAVVHNFNFFRSKIRKSTGVICMLKAAGYGAGSVELARTLQAHGAAYIAVAVVDEGIELRKAGITMPVMVLNPRAQNMKMMFDYNLEPEVYSFDMLDTIINAARRYGVTRFPIHIKVETGMSRLGFMPEDMPRLASLLNDTDTVTASTVFSHLACADDPDDDDYTMQQFDRFGLACDLLDRDLPQPPRRHILNSTGILRFPQYQFDFVRLGIGLYGIPTLYDGSENDLMQVSTLSSVIISVKHWEKGHSIGYNRRTRLDRDSVIATVPVGYADGIDRRLGNRNGFVAIRGHRAPIVGNVCMDILMVDITDLIHNGMDIKVGESVQLFGDIITPMEIADSLSTIPYEILTSVSPRVKRVYYRE